MENLLNSRLTLNVYTHDADMRANESFMCVCEMERERGYVCVCGTKTTLTSPIMQHSCGSIPSGMAQLKKYGFGFPVKIKFNNCYTM